MVVRQLSVWIDLVSSWCGRRSKNRLGFWRSIGRDEWPSSVVSDIRLRHCWRRIAFFRSYNAQHFSRYVCSRRRILGGTRDRLECVPVVLNHLLGVMTELVPAIHVFLTASPQDDVYARDKRGNDDGEVMISADHAGAHEAKCSACQSASTSELILPSMTKTPGAPSLTHALTASRSDSV